MNLHAALSGWIEETVTWSIRDRAAGPDGQYGSAEIDTMDFVGVVGEQNPKSIIPLPDGSVGKDMLFVYAKGEIRKGDRAIALNDIVVIRGKNYVVNEVNYRTQGDYTRIRVVRPTREPVSA